MKKPRNNTDNTTKELIKSADIAYINKMLEKTDDMSDFRISKSTLANIAGWALNGSSDAEIRKNLDLNKHQWAILCTVCPSMIMIMEHSRAMADMVVAGSLFQTAIGGKTIRKQQLIRVKQYDEKGMVIGEKVEKHWVEEELPPNPMLLKFLAENKLNEQFGENKGVDNGKIREFVENLSAHDRALLEAARKSKIDEQN